MRPVVLQPLRISLAATFYLPSLSPVNSCEKSEARPGCPSNVTLFVNHLDSEQSIVPYEYHKFGLCVGSGDESPVENIGQVLFGERIRPSPYEISFKENKKCATLCTKKYEGLEDYRKMWILQWGMRLNYQHHWIVDIMPVTFCFINMQNMTVCTTGFPMGCYVDQEGRQKDACVWDPRYSEPNSYYIFNHVDIGIEYHDMSEERNFLEEKIRNSFFLFYWNKLYNRQLLSQKSHS